jgi:hypothetical protein
MVLVDSVLSLNEDDMPLHMVNDGNRASELLSTPREREKRRKRLIITVRHVKGNASRRRFETVSHSWHSIDVLLQ